MLYCCTTENCQYACMARQYPVNSLRSYSTGLIAPDQVRALGDYPHCRSTDCSLRSHIASPVLLSTYCSRMCGIWHLPQGPAHLFAQCSMLTACVRSVQQRGEIRLHEARVYHATGQPRCAVDRILRTGRKLLVGEICGAKRNLRRQIPLELLCKRSIVVKPRSARGCSRHGHIGPRRGQRAQQARTRTAVAVQTNGDRQRGVGMQLRFRAAQALGRLREKRAEPANDASDVSVACGCGVKQLRARRCRDAAQLLLSRLEVCFSKLVRAARPTACPRAKSAGRPARPPCWRSPTATTANFARRHVDCRGPLPEPARRVPPSRQCQASSNARSKLGDQAPPIKSQTSISFALQRRCLAKFQRQRRLAASRAYSDNAPHHGVLLAPHRRERTWVRVQYWGGRSAQARSSTADMHARGARARPRRSETGC